VISRNQIDLPALGLKQYENPRSPFGPRTSSPVAPMSARDLLMPRLPTFYDYHRACADGNSRLARQSNAVIDRSSASPQKGGLFIKDVYDRLGPAFARLPRHVQVQASRAR